MAVWVDFDAVHAAVTLKQVVEHYGLLDSATVYGNEIKLRCPFHENDRVPSLNVNTEDNIFHCFACEAKGDLISFVVRKEGIDTGNRDHDRRTAALHMQEWFGIRPKRGTRPRRPKRGKVTDSIPEAKSEPAEDETTTARGAIHPPLSFPLKNLDPTHPYLAARGLSRATVDTFGLGYHAGKGIMAGRIAIPIHDAEGVLIGYAGRWPGDEGWPEGEGKYKMPSRDKGFYKSHVLYNLHRAREHAAEGLIVVEGCFMVFELYQKGRRNVVAAMGSTLSPEQERLIVETVGPKGKVLVLFDPDEAGRQGARDAATRLVSQVFVRIVDPLH